MFKKSLYLGSITLVLLALLALAGCSNPAGSSPAGQRGPVIPAAAGPVDDAALVELYAVNNTVRITTGNGTASSVFGVVPPGKTLEIAGSVDIGIGTGETLDVQGTLHILENGELFQNSGVLLVDRTGIVRVDGFVYEELSFFPVTGGLARYLSFGPNGGIAVDDPGSNRAGDVDEYFTLVNRVKWNAAAPSLSLSNWLPGKTLLLNGDSTVGTTDISDNGALVITGNLDPAGTVTPVTTTVTAGATLTTNGIPVLVTETGTLELANNGVLKSTLAGSFKINGTLTATDPSGAPPASFETSVIPPTVDLSGATLLGNSGAQTAVFKFLPNADPLSTEVHIKKIDMSYSLGIANTKGLFVEVISDVASSVALTLPNNVATTVKRIDISGDDLILQGEQGDPASYAIVKPAAIYGGNEATLTGTNILISGPVDLASDTTIGSTGLGPYGTDFAKQLAQLAQINGGIVDVGNTAININSPLTFNTNLTTGTGAVTFVVDTTLTRPITADSYTIAAGRKLTIGQYGRLTTTNLIVGPGVYTAKDGAFSISGAGVISTIVDNASLTIGDAAEPAKLSFKSLANVVATGTFTPATSIVTLSGSLGAIIVPNGATFTVGATAELNIGTNGQIALADTAALTFGVGGKISGFGTTAPVTKADAGVHGTIAGITYDGQVTVVSTNTTFADGVITAGSGFTGSLFAGAPAAGPPPGSGGIIRNNSF
jgi:hypothetical protein